MVGLFARRYRFARVVDGFLVPATAEPLITCQLNGSAEFYERDIGGAWVPRRVRRGDIFVTGSKTPCLRAALALPLGAEIDVIHIHLGVEQCLAAFEMVYQDKANAFEVIDFFGRDETLAHLSFACAEMLSVRTAGRLLRPMEYTKLGNTGMDVSRICLGCMGFGEAERGVHKWVLSDESSQPIIKKALELGINFFDTAKMAIIFGLVCRCKILTTNSN
jgi:hypothetical protein